MAKVPNTGSKPPYIVKLPVLLDIVDPLVISGSLRLINVYIKEAHPSDGWSIEGNDSGKIANAAFGKKIKICYTQTKTLETRLQVARDFMDAIKTSAKFEGKCWERVPLFVDNPEDDAVAMLYESPPEKLVCIHKGKVVFATGQGPMQYSLKKLKDFLGSEFARL